MTPADEGRPDRATRPVVTLVAMTLAASTILVDQTAVPLALPDVVRGLDTSLDLSNWVLTANILPLAALMVVGGRLGDIFGLRRIFLLGATVFAASTALAGASQDMAWMIAARACQGAGAALMMPSTVAIVSAVYPAERRGSALGILAGASAFFAALGPVLGGTLTSIDWRLVFLINIPIALVAVFLTLRATPRLEPDRSGSRSIDWGGAATFGVAISAIVLALNQGAADGWDGADVIVPFAVALVSLAGFVAIERRVEEPLIEFRLFRHLNFLAANISQALAGMVELGLGFLLPFFLLLVVGIGPVTAGIALIPATIPIILAGPLAGRAYDRIGARIPLVVGFLALAASGLLLAVEASDASATALIPGLLLQGIGLGVVLTTNDPTGLMAVPESDRGQAAGVLNTTEQMGGALGIAALGAIEVAAAENGTISRLEETGITPTESQIDRFRDFILEAEQEGLSEAVRESSSTVVDKTVELSRLAHIEAFEIVFSISAGLALVGALACLVLVRRTDRVAGPVFSRRSRWVLSSAGTTPGLTRKPPPEPLERP